MTTRHHRGRPLRRALAALAAALTATALQLTASAHEPTDCRTSTCTTR